MPSERSFPEGVEALIARYLRGEIGFDAAATELAEILQSLMQPRTDLPPQPARPPGPIKLKPLTVEQWITPPTEGPIGGVLQVRRLTPSGREEDEEKARALLEEAFRRAQSSMGGAV
jgi:hypothetical protein